MIEITNESTGEVTKVQGEIMIALNGRAFIKHKGKTVFSSGHLITRLQLDKVI